jgi:hypothetical protein
MQSSILLVLLCCYVVRCTYLIYLPTYSCHIVVLLCCHDVFFVLLCFRVVVYIVVRCTYLIYPYLATVYANDTDTQANTSNVSHLSPPWKLVPAST